MASQAWKAFERRVCRALGGQRRGPGGGTDDNGTGPFAVECKHVSRFALREDWLAQAKRQGKADGRPWLLVIGRRYTQQTVAVLDFVAFAQLCEEAGRLEVPADELELEAPA